MKCLGERYIGAGVSNEEILLEGVPGNALGAYLDGGKIILHGNAQDATGDTMNDGLIVIHGNTGDAAGYAMRGGAIYIKGNAGYRAGIHMKEYKDKKPVIVIGGSAGSFLGEYLAGGIIIVLGLSDEEIIGSFAGTGMHGGKIYLRTNKAPKNLPIQVSVNQASQSDLKEIEEYLKKYSEYFTYELKSILKSDFYILTPNTKNPYKQLYVYN